MFSHIFCAEITIKNSFWVLKSPIFTVLFNSTPECLATLSFPLGTCWWTIYLFPTQAPFPFVPPILSPVLNIRFYFSMSEKSVAHCLSDSLWTLSLNITTWSYVYFLINKRFSRFLELCSILLCVVPHALIHSLCSRINFLKTELFAYLKWTGFNG